MYLFKVPNKMSQKMLVQKKLVEKVHDAVNLNFLVKQQIENCCLVIICKNIQPLSLKTVFKFNTKYTRVTKTQVT